MFKKLLEILQKFLIGLGKQQAKSEWEAESAAIVEEHIAEGKRIDAKVDAMSESELDDKL